MKISVFRTFFLIRFAYIEMKLGIIVYNNELQIKFEFRRYWSVFDRVMAIGLSHTSRGQVCCRRYSSPI
jgi:hypothetical protein